MKKLSDNEYRGLTRPALINRCKMLEEELQTTLSNIKKILYENEFDVIGNEREYEIVEKINKVLEEGVE